jgi:signal peptidase II
MKDGKIALAPFWLTAAVVLLDQLTKAIVVAKIPLDSVGFSAFGDFLWFARQANRGMAFSLFDELPEAWRLVFLVALPLLLVTGVLVYYFRSRELTLLQRWALCGIAGGGIGNVIDRIFRPEGVVDFISVKFYGLFGYNRWPTFNVADSSVVVCAILLAASTIALDLRRKK